MTSRAEAPGTVAERRKMTSLRDLELNAQLVFGVALLASMFFVALAAPVLTTYDPYAIDISQIRTPPSAEHWFGTDAVGRDLSARVALGGRISLLVASFGMVGSLVLGSMMGMLSAFGGKFVRTLVDRSIDVQLAFPYILLAIAITSVVRPSTPVLVLLMVLAGWAAAARVVRSIALQELGKDYVKAASVLGVPRVRIAAVHVFPSVVPSLQVLAAMQMAAMIVFEATLSFLGMGVQPPEPSWGGIMLDGKNFMTTSWWLMVFPGLAILITSLSLVLLGDGLQKRRAKLRTQEE